MSELEKVLVERDEMTPAQAHKELIEMRLRVLEGEDPEEIFYNLGLEPDYTFDLIEF